MLAERARVVIGVAVAAIATIGVTIAVTRESEMPTHPDDEVVACRVRSPHEAPIEVTPSTSPDSISTDTLFVVMRDEVEVTNVVEESDWAKTYHMVWDGPIRSWTTMRNVRVPSLDHRMIESIEPVGTERHAIYVHVRVVVPGDLEAALDWVRSRPDVESASVRLEYEY